MSKQTLRMMSQYLKYRPENTQIYLFRASESQTCLIKLARPKPPKIVETRKLNVTHDRSAFDVISRFTLLVAMFCSQIAMSRMYFNFIEQEKPYPDFNGDFSKSLATSKSRPSNANSS